MEFTKEIKNNWLKALKSGEFNKGQTNLKFKRQNKVKHCCLGVLAEIHPRLSIGKVGGCQLDGEDMDYRPFDMLIGEEKYKELYRANDSLENANDNFASVIPLIEKLETVD